MSLGFVFNILRPMILSGDLQSIFLYSYSWPVFQIVPPSHFHSPSPKIKCKEAVCCATIKNIVTESNIPQFIH